ncbi:MAG: FtsQ-type POTRA domain-containing protein [Bryobacterales bacterium]|nr:FtsQ-type POTRA domain-containing protein [Bryobacterales bacterium]
MARRTLEEPEFEVTATESDDAPREKPVRRPRAPRKEDPSAKAPKRRTINLFYWTMPFVALLGVLLLIFVFHQLETLMIRDSRFHLQPPAEYGQDPPTLSISGHRHASRAAILRVFEADLGRSLYLFPVEERRRQLLAVDWVKDARVSRRWPNRVVVEVMERQPVAFVQLSRPGVAPSFKLIDADGVILPVPQGEKLNFAVLTGISENEAVESRRTRVRQALAMQQEIGSLTSHISEIDVRDPGNIQVLAQIDQDVLTLKLGNRNFLSRLKDFLAHYPDIRSKRPDARSFDLRIDHQIFAAEVASNGQQR